MSLKDEDRRIIVTLELERVDKTLKEMDIQRRNGLWGMVANRLYYALFHAVSALLISDQHEVGTHRGAVNRFSLYYVKTGIFTNEEGRLYSQLQSLREDGDYNCSIDIQQNEAEEKIEPTLKLIEKIKQYIANK
ncbi:MAG: HEPN domain-containing protein [Prevotella sp.]|nr:HEPN domain-containing protein [Prevotella sp.]